ncbi:MAG: cyclophilin-like fold protein [bacterium]|nr:cyclophilin-like fold protein [bacterium]
MPEAIQITVGEITLDAELNDSNTAAQILDVLPLTCSFNTWGDEIYFAIPVDADPEDPQETVALNDLGYWPPGQAFCIFYGQTPASVGDEIRPASPVNPIGRVLGDATVLKDVSGVREISLEKV